MKTLKIRSLAAALSAALLLGGCAGASSGAVFMEKTRKQKPGRQRARVFALFFKREKRERKERRESNLFC